MDAFVFSCVLIIRGCDVPGEQSAAGRVRAARRGQDLGGHLPEPLGSTVGVWPIRQGHPARRHVRARARQHGPSC